MTKGKVISIISNLLMIDADGPVTQNEICLIKAGRVSLKAEVIRVKEGKASAQLFESSTSIRIGAAVEFTGKMLEVSLGPGILSKKYDGLQNDLEKMHGTFIELGEDTNPLDDDRKFDFTPICEIGQHVVAGDWLGCVPEFSVDHMIMVPFILREKYRVEWLAPAGVYQVNEVIARLKDAKGEIHEVTMVQKWPVKFALRGYQSKRRPGELFQTGLRVIDTLNPMTEGGTGYIPGPFGTGKTVLQQAIAKNSIAQVLIVVACGERANEVVEIFSEFPKLVDPATGRKLDEKTAIICNTSNMPVAAREASVYVGMTLAEYYRNMGLKVLLLADSTSRWAQALREMSNRMEELPGQDAFPVELPATIANFYGRAGIVELNNGQTGSVTFIGTISPAGGNFKEPVTESTGKVARCFYALSQKRADSKRYPAIDPLASYSKYLDYKEFEEFTSNHIKKGWVDDVRLVKDIMRVGIDARDQISILGDDAVPIDYHVNFWKSELIDFGFIQQDSFDPVDMQTGIERQSYMLEFLLQICHQPFEFEEFEEVSLYFKRIIDRIKQMNYSEFQSEQFKSYEEEVRELLNKSAHNEKESIS